MKNLILIITISLSLLGGCSGGGVEIPPPPPDPIVPAVPGQKILSSISSNYVYDNYTYPVQIYLPDAYKTNKNLPIIYLLDGTFNFTRVVNLLLDSNIDAILVGVGDFASKQQWTRRWVDMLPGTKCHGTGGQLPNFYNFITKELVPFIDSKYENDHNSRTLMGHSSAGLFTFVSMYIENPDQVMFHNFIASDPELECDRTYFDGILHDNVFLEGSKKFKLYLALSGDGDIGAVKHFAKIIQEKEYTWLTFKYEEFLNESHLGVLNPSYKSGLKFIFE